MAGKREREAQQQAVDAYLKNWKKLKRIDGAMDRPLNTRSLPKIEDEAGELDVGTKTMIRKADRVARDVNKEFPEFKAAVDKYNRRYDEFQRQLNNQSVSKEFLDEKRNAAKKEYERLRGAREAADRDRKGQIGSYNIMKPINISPAKDQSSVRKQLEGRSNGYQDVMGHYNPTEEELAALDMRLNAGTYYGPATSWRKTLPAHEQAAKDFNELSEQVNNKKEFMAAQEKYAGIAQKITAKLKRETGNPKPTTGLLQSELMTGNPVQEVIK